MRTLIIGLGVEFLGDDAAGIQVARRLHGELPEEVDVIERTRTALALLEDWIGYDRVILVDSIQTRLDTPGTTHEFTRSDLDRMEASSPYFAGVPELVAQATRLELEVPSDIALFTIETTDTCNPGNTLSAPIDTAVRQLSDRILRYVQAALGEPAG